MGGKTKLQIIHVAGTRMIVQGTDGLSRGQVTEGVMTGKRILQFISLHLSAMHENPKLLCWFQYWCGHHQIQPLTPNQWFREGHGHLSMKKRIRGICEPVFESEGVYLWAPPPPAATDVAIDELCKTRHKRKGSTHLFVVPRRWTYLWRRKLFCACDIRYLIAAGSPLWNEKEHDHSRLSYFPLL